MLLQFEVFTLDSSCIRFTIFILHLSLFEEMGGGKKTQTFVLNEASPSFASKASYAASARNLRKSQLGGVIFGCTRGTFRECLSKQLFG